MSGKDHVSVNQFSTEEMRRAHETGTPVQLPMFARARDLRDAVVDGTLSSVDRREYDSGQDWVDMKVSNRSLGTSIEKEGVHEPVTMYTPSRDDRQLVGRGFSEPMRAGSLHLGDGNHRVAEAGKHPDALIPVVWDDKDFMNNMERWR